MGEMKNAIIIGTISLALFGIVIYYVDSSACRRCDSNCRADIANATVREIQTIEESAALARQIVDSADDCGIKRMLCATARGGCDQQRVCDTLDRGRDNAGRAAVDGEPAPNSAE